MDHFKETTQRGYGTNIANSFKGILFGIILLIGSIILLWWNEGRSIDQATALQEMQENIITLPNTNYHAEYKEKAILLQGLLTPLHPVLDTEFGVSTDGLLLRKNVEMYQWREDKQSESRDKLGGGTETITTYDYEKGWSSNSIDSSSFKHPTGHHNPTMTRKSQTFFTDGQLGEYYLGRDIVKQISTFQNFDGLNTMLDKIGIANNYKSFLYIGVSPDKPVIGDIKITYMYAPSAIYTFAGKSGDKSLIFYRTDNGKSFLFVRSGRVDAGTIFQEELDANSFLTWLLRGVGLLLMFIGFTLIMGPLSTLANVIPMLGTIIGGATGIIAGVLTLFLGSIIIALAWFSVRPMLSFIILGVGFAVAIGMSRFGKKTAKESPIQSKSTHRPVEKKKSTTPPPRKRSSTPPPRSS